MEENVNIRKKAELTLGGCIKLPDGFKIPFRTSRSTAGPGAGSESVAIKFEGFRVKKAISFECGDFELHDNMGTYSLTKGGEPFIDKIEIIPIAHHCPEQAFFNLDQRCIFNCAYCASPKLSESEVKNLTDETIVQMIQNTILEQKIVSASFTSGVIVDVDNTVNRFISCIKAVKNKFPDMIIGVEPYVSKKEQIQSLKDAGANEIKLNIESPSEKIFYRICPELDYKGILNLLEDAVEIFGEGKVSSNIIFGLGETDEELENMIDYLASKGVIPTLRSIRYNSFNKERMEEAVGILPKVSVERTISLTKMQKRVLEKHNLTTLDCRTMCLECTCCDLVPFRDL